MATLHDLSPVENQERGFYLDLGDYALGVPMIEAYFLSLLAITKIVALL